jgi:hypothetical protein
MSDTIRLNDEAKNVQLRLQWHGIHNKILDIARASRDREDLNNQLSLISSDYDEGLKL